MSLISCGVDYSTVASITVNTATGHEILQTSMVIKTELKLYDYVESTTTMHNLLIFDHMPWMNKTMKHFHWLLQQS